MNDLASVSSIWREVLAVSFLNPSLYNFFLENVVIRIGDGNRVKFLDDIWLGTSSLKYQFPRLHQLSVNKEVTLKMQMSCRVGSNFWCFKFRRHLFG